MEKYLLITVLFYCEEWPKRKRAVGVSISSVIVDVGVLLTSVFYV